MMVQALIYGFLLLFAAFGSILADPSTCVSLISISVIKNENSMISAIDDTHVLLTVCR